MARLIAAQLTIYATSAVVALREPLAGLLGGPPWFATAVGVVAGAVAVAATFALRGVARAQHHSVTDGWRLLHLFVAVAALVALPYGPPALLTWLVAGAALQLGALARPTRGGHPGF